MRRPGSHRPRSRLLTERGRETVALVLTVVAAVGAALLFSNAPC